ncbi:MAG: hypothetical protein K2Y22_13120 [Candidatus Obscuribacterales bacterium]|nr:hypothetical protein [Candidatus Obscuribacterales bacterium]
MIKGITERRILLTSNCNDFSSLSKQIVKSGKQHSGILLVYEYNNPIKDMSYEDIFTAINNLEKTKLNLRNQVIPLNSYKY